MERGYKRRESRPRKFGRGKSGDLRAACNSFNFWLQRSHENGVENGVSDNLNASAAAPLADSTLRPHRAYQSLGSRTAERQSAYRALFDQVLGNDDINEIRAHIQQQRALGNDRFRAMVERKLGRCASVRPAHRPPAPIKPTDKAL